MCHRQGLSCGNWSAGANQFNALRIKLFEPTEKVTLTRNRWWLKVLQYGWDARRSSRASYLERQATLSMLRAILVDLDNTLLDDRGAMAAAVLQLRAQQKLAPGIEDRELVHLWDSVGRQQWKAMELGQVTFLEQRRLRLRQMFQLEISDDTADALFADYLAHYENAWSLLPGAREFLKATDHLPRVIVTNGNKSQAIRKTDKLGLTGQFLAVVTPEDCGGRKPDPRIFLHALSLLGASAHEALMIGDDREADLVPAEALGMKTFHVSHLDASQSILHAASVIYPSLPKTNAMTH